VSTHSRGDFSWVQVSVYTGSHLSPDRESTSDSDSWVQVSVYTETHLSPDRESTSDYDSWDQVSVYTETHLSPDRESTSDDFFSDFFLYDMSFIKINNLYLFYNPDCSAAFAAASPRLV
jgi:hypothetical protein